MKQTTTINEKIKQFIQILLPILITQIALFSMTFFDTVMSGHASANDLAGVAVGSSLWSPIFTGLNGILLALTPIVSQLLGAEKKEKIAFYVIQAMYLAAIIALLVILVGAFSVKPLLEWMNLDSEVRRIAYQFLVALSLGIFPLFIYTVFRCFMDALGKTITTMLISLISLPINVTLNYILIYGKFGFPRLGGVGAGYASAITYWCIAIIAFVVIQKKTPFFNYNIFKQLFPFSPGVWKELLGMGIPIGFSIFFETSIFAAVTLLMSEFNTETIAAHQAAINFASLLYMIPMSIAMALTITVGFEAGAKRLKHAKQYSFLGIAISIFTATVCSIALITCNKQVAALYTTDPGVLLLTQHFLLYAIFFQFSDGIAAPIQGALRGYKDVNATFLAAFISYWILGLPIGFLLAKFTTAGPFGYWIGLISGLASGAIFLSYRLLKLQRIMEQKRKQGAA